MVDIVTGGPKLRLDEEVVGGTIFRISAIFLCVISLYWRWCRCRERMYYYNDGENSVGPFSMYHLKVLRENGLIAHGTLVRRGDARDWAPFSEWILEGEKQDTQIGRSLKSTPTKDEASLGKPSSHSNPSLQPIGREENIENDKSACSGTPQATAQRGSNIESQPEQYSDPAYKYMPRDKKKSAEGDYRSTRPHRDEDDPAYKYMPKDKKKSSEGEYRSIRPQRDEDDPAYKYMPRSKAEMSEAESALLERKDGMRYYFDFKGTATRAEFWVIIIISMVVLAINDVLLEMWIFNGLAIIPFVFVVIFLWLIISTSARRCRSAGLNPYLSALMVVPLVGFIALFVFGIIKPKEDLSN